MNERILEHWDIAVDLLPLFLDHPDGLALLALLCNAGVRFPVFSTARFTILVSIGSVKV